MALKHAILAILSGGNYSGYDLVRTIDESIGFFWKATHQQIYRELALLREQRFLDCEEVKQAGKPNKKIYRSTVLGTQELLSWISGSTEPAVNKDALMIKFFVGHLVPSEILLKHIYDQRASVRKKLSYCRSLEKLYLDQKEHFKRPAHFHYMVMLRGILNCEAWLTWSEIAEGFILDEEKKDRAKVSASEEMTVL